MVEAEIILIENLAFAERTRVRTRKVAVDPNTNPMLIAVYRNLDSHLEKCINVGATVLKQAYINPELSNALSECLSSAAHLQGSLSRSISIKQNSEIESLSPNEGSVYEEDQFLAECGLKEYLDDLNRF